MTQARYASVWDAIERTPSDAAHMKLRAELLLHLQQSLARRDGTQAQKAQAIGISQPRLNDLLRGRIDRFSLDALVDLIQAQGGEVEIRIRAAPSRKAIRKKT